MVSKSLIRDALTEAANIGSGWAMSSLGELAGRAIRFGVPRWMEESTTEKDSAAAALAICLEVHGGTEATFVLLFERDDAAALAYQLTQRAPTEPWSDLEDSALMEAGNIMASAFAGALCQVISMNVTPRPPVLERGTMTELAEKCLRDRRRPMGVEVVFGDEHSEVCGKLLFVWESEAGRRLALALWGES